MRRRTNLSGVDFRGQIEAGLTSELSTAMSSESLLSFASDDVVAIVGPIITYWVASGFFATLDTLKHPATEKYRIHPEEELTKNRVGRLDVFKGVVLQQIAQAGLAFVFLWLQGTKELDERDTLFDNYLLPALKFMMGMIIMDTWQYFLHRLFHQNKWLYRNIHAWHHTLYVPYAYGALYNNPIEGFLFDSLGAAAAAELSGMTVRGSIFFWCFSTLKTVDDHCGYNFPYDPLQRFFGNNAFYHDLHHQLHGLKVNFSQPYFTFWDRILGTYEDPVQAAIKHNEKKAAQKSQ
ncbi:sphingoid base hydroxylase 1 [Planoprotostelium fungivorum]|uniref:Sphingoid base hydroxylase 1 n=1 Tax=Planoprotostelium fungivorum TaxID=1890364 RepID=A0A2P6NU36_9EUKA|nr:sphingoid base hydroxylase 1 [Planoprotostelium fungivorum]